MSEAPWARAGACHTALTVFSLVVVVPLLLMNSLM